MKTDVYREHQDEYVAPKEPALVTIGAGRYLAIEGTGSPQETEFQEKLAVLYGAAYTLKFASKKKGRDFKVGMLEGLWSAVGGGRTALAKPKRTWRWKLVIRVPSFVTPAALASALGDLRAKKGPGPLPAVKLETIREGRAVQMLHVGAYADEPSTIARMDAFAKEHRLRFRGAHHEIYLSDPRRVPPARLRTILRHAVVPVRARSSGA